MPSERAENAARRIVLAMKAPSRIGGSDVAKTADVAKIIEGELAVAGPTLNSEEWTQVKDALMRLATMDHDQGDTENCDALNGLCAKIMSQQRQ